MSKNIAKIKFLSILVFILMFNLTFISPSSSHEGEDHSIAPSDHVWKLLKWNEENTVEWWSQGLIIDASINSYVIYNVTKQNNDNYTHPNSGKLSIGNLTNIETDNADIASVLLLSIYPWSPGLITETGNWSYHVEVAKTIAETSEYLKGSLTVNKSFEFEFEGSNRYAVKFEYQQGPSGNQNTTLIYDSETGVLLYGYSEILFTNLFKIELKLDSSSLIESSNEPPTNSPGFDYPFMLLGIVIISIFRSNIKSKIKK